MFREKYRSLEVLLVDDIQFIRGKVTSQEAVLRIVEYPGELQQSDSLGFGLRIRVNGDAWKYRLRIAFSKVGLDRYEIAPTEYETHGGHYRIDVIANERNLETAAILIGAFVELQEAFQMRVAN